MDQSKTSENSDFEVYIRRADLDDVEPINALIDSEAKNNIDQLYDFPNVLNLFEK